MKIHFSAEYLNEPIVKEAITQTFKQRSNSQEGTIDYHKFTNLIFGDKNIIPSEKAIIPDKKAKALKQTSEEKTKSEIKSESKPQIEDSKTVETKQEPTTQLKPATKKLDEELKLEKMDRSPLKGKPPLLSETKGSSAQLKLEIIQKKREALMKKKELLSQQSAARLQSPECSFGDISRTFHAGEKSTSMSKDLITTPNIGIRSPEYVLTPQNEVATPIGEIQTPKGELQSLKEDPRTPKNQILTSGRGLKEYTHAPLMSPCIPRPPRLTNDVADYSTKEAKTTNRLNHLRSAQYNSHCLNQDLTFEACNNNPDLTSSNIRPPKIKRKRVLVISKKRNRDGSVSVSRQQMYDMTVSEAIDTVRKSINPELKFEVQTTRVESQRAQSIKELQHNSMKQLGFSSARYSLTNNQGRPTMLPRFETQHSQLNIQKVNTYRGAEVTGPGQGTSRDQGTGKDLITSRDQVTSRDPGKPPKMKTVAIMTRKREQRLSRF